MEKDEKEELKSRPASRVLDAGKQEKPEEVLSTEVTKEDLADAVEDEFGAKYSKDGKRLLMGKDVETYEIRQGTRVICDWAFYGCESLESVIIPSGVTQIGKNPFVGCKCDIGSHSPRFKVKDNVLYDSDMSVLIAYLSEQTVFSIPSSVTQIGDCAFRGCVSLKSIVIPSGLTRIGDSAFMWCESLQSVSIPSSVTRIGDWAFSGCESLQSVAIPSSVTRIDNYAFYSCKSLHSVVIPSSVTRIGDEAFRGCESLQSVSIPSSVTRIGDEAFRRCVSLQSVVIPSSVTRIGDSAFRECKSLQSVSIPSSVTRIGKNPFVGCKCDIESHSPHFTVKDNVLYDSDMSVLIACLSKQTTFSIPSSVTRIGDCAFEECKSLESVVIPSSVTRIGNESFRRCKSLQSVAIPSSVTHIGHSAFEECYSLQSVVIQSGSPTSATVRFLYGCESLQQITIPKGSREKFEKLLPYDYEKDKLVEI